MINSPALKDPPGTCGILIFIFVMNFQTNALCAMFQVKSFVSLLNTDSSRAREAAS